MSKRFYFIPLLILLPLFSFGQLQEESIRVVSRAYGDSIVLRWAPSSPVAWQLLNKYGYRLERYTIARDSEVLKQKTRIDLNVKPVKPAESGQWIPAMDDDYVAVAAQAIFGSSFETGNKKSSLIEIVNKSKELDSRFSFALFAADLSSHAASLSGLRWVDKSVKKNEKYLYRVYSLVPPNELSVRMGYAFQDGGKTDPLPKPHDPKADFSDHLVLLEWDANQLKGVYTSYVLEKSVDEGKTISVIRRNITPIAEGEEKLKRLSINDSLKQNETTVMYRIYGINNFGDRGPSSEWVSGKGRSKEVIPVRIIDYKIINNQSIQIKWSIPETSKAVVKGFIVERATNVDGDYRELNPVLAGDVLEYSDNVPLPTNYYRLVALDNANQKHFSNPHLIQLADSIPPIAPNEVSATIDSLGRVTLNWQSNKEPDLLGYHVFRSNFKNSEFSRITNSPVQIASFLDSINVKTLLRKIYYKVVAVDTRFNTSSYSELRELIIPDQIPPVAPVIKSFQSTLEGINICWLKSASDDVVDHLLFRKGKQEPTWTLLKIFHLSDSTCFIDRPVVELAYQYRIEAKDEAGLITSSKEVTVKSLTKPIYGIQNLLAEIDRSEKTISLNWKLETGISGISRFLIYRSYNNEPLTVYKTVSGDRGTFNDRGLEINSVYSYRVKILFENGKESLLSNAITVNY